MRFPRALRDQEYEIKKAETGNAVQDDGSTSSNVNRIERGREGERKKERKRDRERER